MDPFTQKLLERTRQRREILQKKLHDNNGASADSVETPAATQLLDQLSSTTKSEKADVVEKEAPSKRISTSSKDAPQDQPIVASPVPAPRSFVSPDKSKAILNKENEAKLGVIEVPAVAARVQPVHAGGVGPRQTPSNRVNWDSAVSSIMTEEKTASSSKQPQQGGRFASLAAKINSWEDDAENNSQDASATSRSRLASNGVAAGKPSPFESPVALVQQRLSGSSSTPTATKGFQFGPKPVAALQRGESSSNVEVPPNKPPRIPDSPSRASPTTRTHEPGVFHSPPRSTAVVARPPSPQSKLITSKPVSPKMKALQANLESKLNNGWQENDIAKKVDEEKKQDMKSLLNRWEKASSNQDPPKPTSGSTTPGPRKVSISGVPPAPSQHSIASSIFAKKSVPPPSATLPPQIPPARSSTAAPLPELNVPSSPETSTTTTPNVPPPSPSPSPSPPPPPTIPIPASLTPSKSKSRMMELALKSSGSTPPKNQACSTVESPMELDEEEASNFTSASIAQPVAPPRKRKSDRHLDQIDDNPRFSTASSASLASACSEASSLYETSSEARSSVTSYREGEEEEDEEYDGATTNTEDEETEEEETKVAGHQDDNISDFLDAAFDGLEDDDDQFEEDEEEDEDDEDDDEGEGAPPMKKQASETEVQSRGSSSSSQSSLQKNSVSNIPSKTSRSTSDSAMQTPSKNAILRREPSTKPIVYSVQEYRTLQRKKLEERPYLNAHVIRESEHFYALKTEETSSSSLNKPVKNAQQTIKELQVTVQSEQVVIAQASKALNAALQQPDFHGSMEMVECNRLLLLACQKRQACLEEIGRLKTLGWGQDTASGNGACRGTVTVSDMRLPLKPKFLQMRSEGLDTCIHYYICMIKHGPQLIHTQMLSTLDGISGDHFYFSNRMVIRDIPPDFELRIDVYGLEVAKKSHAQKVQGGASTSPKKSKKTKKGKKTPKKNKLLGFRSSGEVSGHQSPINSFAVSTTSFTHLDSVAINAKSLCHDKFALSVSNSNPLNGVLYVKIQCHTDANVVEKGFLTMFEDVSGLGAWHRRWIVLSGYKLSFWKYPDDENKKPPMGTIDLMECISTLPITIISRDICARPNTFALETIHPGKAGETETLVLKRSIDAKNSMVERHMLSADTKEDRVVWCNVLNKALNNLRMWNPNALRPMPKREDCIGMTASSSTPRKGVPV